MLKELAHGVYVETSYESGNVGVVLYDQPDRRERGALLIDTPMYSKDVHSWQRTLRDLEVAGVHGIVNTDDHPEHFLGNAAFMPTRIWGHEYAAKQVAKFKASSLEQGGGEPEPNAAFVHEVGQVEVHAPELCIEDRATLYLGDRRVEILYLNGHTPASLGVYLPTEHILFAGDNIVNNEHPVMFQANSAAWLETLERIRAMEIETIVPGNGEPCGKDAAEPLARYITEMRQRVTELFRAGASRRECVEKVGMLEFFPIPETQAALLKRRRRENVERVYTEIRTAQRKH